MNHNSSKCPMRLDIIDKIRRHVGRHRQEISRLLVEAGYGVGALLSCHEYWSGRTVNCLMTQETFDRSIAALTLFEYRNIKYTKRVRVSMLEHLHVAADSINSNEVYWRNVDAISVFASPVEVGCGSELSCAVHLADIGGGKIRNPLATEAFKANNRWSRWGSLLLPSNDGGASPETLNGPFLLNERLVTDRLHRSTTPILP